MSSTHTKCSTSGKSWGFSTAWILLLVLFAGCAQQPAPEDAAPSLTEAELQKLESLGYINTTEVSDEDLAKRGVELWQRDKAQEGFNLYSSGAAREALLIAMDGSVVHRWASEEVGLAYRRFQELGHPPWYMNGWERLHLTPGGGLVANGSHHQLLALDAQSAIELAVDIPVHHDFALAATGEYFLIVDAPRQVLLEGEDFTVTDNHVVVLDGGGNEVRRISVLDALLDSPALRPAAARAIRRTRNRQETRLKFFRRTMKGAEGELARQLDRRNELFTQALAGDLENDHELKVILLHHPATDILHSNSIQISPAPVSGLWPAGAILLCVNRLNTVLVLDPSGAEVLWSWGSGELDLPHHATQLASGNILIFDNGSGRKYSRVVEVNPGRQAIVWQYLAEPPDAFFSNSRGGAQRLDNGNTLITETDRGRAFEVTPDGEIVWEFHNPDLDGNHRGTMYRMSRHSAEEVAALLP